jgi:hypothetical protein
MHLPHRRNGEVMNKKIPVLLVLSLVLMPVLAEDKEITNPLAKFTHAYSTRTINPDGSSTDFLDYAVTVLAEEGIDDIKQKAITYSTSAEKLEVVNAYTKKANGKRIDVPKSNFQIEVNSGKDGNSPAFSDQTTLTLIFPDVAVGDTIYFSYKLTQAEPLFPGQFSAIQTYPKSKKFEDVRVKIDIPENMQARYEIAGLKEKKVEQNNGRKIFEWTYQNKKPVEDKEDGATIYQFGRQPGFMFSTFPSYASIAEAYGARAKPKAQVTERIQKLADEITKGKATPYEKAKSLYEWVSKNISYAGNCIGVGSVVPRDTGFVLDNHMGDCKDHATLLEALLAAKKIGSTQALINTHQLYNLPKIPVVSIVNHVINYIPSLKIFADATAEGTPFGLLPDGETGKPVLLVDGYQEGLKTPAMTHEDRRQAVKATISIGEDGSAKGEVEWTSEGRQALFANSPRTVEKWNEFKIDKKKVDEYSKNMIKKHGFGGGTIAFHMDQPPKSPGTAKSRISFDVKGFIHAGIAGAFQINPIFSQSAIFSLVKSTKAADDTLYDFSCAGGHFLEEYVYEFPKNIKILAAPDNFSARNELVSYHAEYALSGNTLTAKRQYDDLTLGPVCEPKIAKAYKEVAEKAMPNLESQVVYK